MASQGFSFKITGDIKRFKAFLNPSRFNRVLDRHIRKATIKNSLFLVKKVKEGIRKRKFQKKSILSRALSKSTIPLINEKNLMDAISHELKNSFESEVGIIKNRQSTGGASRKGIKLQKVVELMHEGYTIEVTAKMRAAIAARLREIGTTKATNRLKRMESIGQKKGGLAAYKVPKRPFLEVVFKNPGNKSVVKENWRRALEDVWKEMGATEGEHRDR